MLHLLFNAETLKSRFQQGGREGMLFFFIWNICSCFKLFQQPAF